MQGRETSINNTFLHQGWQMTTIGIDVGAKELVVAVRHKQVTKIINGYPNTASGITKIRALCEKYLKYGPVRIAMEATGVYYLDAAIALSENKQFEIIVANPRATKAFSTAIMDRTKTDKVDSQMLALFAEKMDYPLWQRPSSSLIALRCYSRTIHSLTEDKAKACNYLHALSFSKETPQNVIELVKSNIEFLEQIIAKAKEEVIAVIHANENLKQSFALLQTITGCGESSAIQILAEVSFLPEGLSHKQWVAYAGLDPRQYQSGTSVNKKPRISKAGNRYLRKALFMPALSASTHDPYVKQYVNHLVENRGLRKIQAIVAVMRKLLHAIHGMLLRNKPFDNTRFFGAQKLVSVAVA